VQSISKIMDAKDRAIASLANKVGVHKHTLEQGTNQLASAVETGLGGAAAAAIDFYFGSATASGIKEAMIPGTQIPAVASVGLLMKVGAISLHIMSKGKETAATEVAASHLGNVADGLLAGSAALTTYRVLAELGTSAPAAAA
jgi:hypothetical protein